MKKFKGFTSQQEKNFFSILKKQNDKELDKLFSNLHEEAFAHINCMDCGNCCKSLPPIINNTDIARISKYLRLKDSEFRVNYLTIDDEDLVFKKTPCVFLEPDNSCLIYDVRPRSCKEYPHTQRDNMKGILHLTFRNATVCPAVKEILEKLRLHFKI